MSPLKMAASSDPAGWIAEGLHGFAVDVGSIVPAEFEAYARVFHPGWAGGPEGRPVRWAEIAASTGRTFHEGAQWPHVACTSEVDDNDLQHPPPGVPWTSSPEEGSLDRAVVERLVGLLRPHTSTAESCWFAFWDGWGVPFTLRPVKKGLFTRKPAGEQAPEDAGQKALLERWDAPKFSIPGRDLLLFSGSLHDAMESFYEPMGAPSFQTAYFWWPDDRAWFVATEIDFDSTYIGGSRACIDALVRDDLLEALEVRLDQGVSWASDTINPNPMRRQS